MKEDRDTSTVMPETREEHEQAYEAYLLTRSARELETFGLSRDNRRAIEAEIYKSHALSPDKEPEQRKLNLEPNKEVKQDVKDRVLRHLPNQDYPEDRDRKPSKDLSPDYPKI